MNKESIMGSGTNNGLTYVHEVLSKLDSVEVQRDLEKKGACTAYFLNISTHNV
jgi:hypothetical protein